MSVQTVSAYANIKTPPTRLGLLGSLRDYWALTKPEVNFLVVMSTLAGFYLAARGPLDLARLLHTLLGTLFVASGTATLNQLMERDADAQMRRTTSRPLPSGRLSGGSSLGFGLALAVVGGGYLWLAVNALTSLLALSTLASYLLIYTPLKRRTPWCTFVGAFPGAMPPLIGWAGATGHLSMGRGSSLGFSFCGNFRISWRLLGCTARIMRARDS